MRSDMSVTVTRDTPVTSRVTRTCDITRLSRVSHATTTTPHHTTPDLLVTSASSSSNHLSFIPHLSEGHE